MNTSKKNKPWEEIELKAYEIKGGDSIKYRIYKTEEEFLDIEAPSAADAIEQSKHERPFKVLIVSPKNKLYYNKEDLEVKPVEIPNQPNENNNDPKEDELKSKGVESNKEPNQEVNQDTSAQEINQEPSEATEHLKNPEDASASKEEIKEDTPLKDTLPEEK